MTNPTNPPTNPITGVPYIQTYLNELQRQIEDAGKQGGQDFGKAITSGIERAAKAFGAGVAKVEPSAATAANISAHGLISAGVDTLASAAGALPGIGPAAKELVNLKGREFEQGVFGPLDKTQARLGEIAGNLAAAGYQLRDEDIELGSSRVIEQERRRLVAERRVASVVYSSGNVVDAMSFGWQVMR